MWPLLQPSALPWSEAGRQPVTAELARAPPRSINLQAQGWSRILHATPPGPQCGEQSREQPMHSAPWAEDGRDTPSGSGVPQATSLAGSLLLLPPRHAPTFPRLPTAPRTQALREPGNPAPPSNQAQSCRGALPQGTFSGSSEVLRHHPCHGLPANVPTGPARVPGGGISS